MQAEALPAGHPCLCWPRDRPLWKGNGSCQWKEQTAPLDSQSPLGKCPQEARLQWEPEESSPWPAAREAGQAPRLKSPSQDIQQGPWDSASHQCYALSLGHLPFQLPDTNHPRPPLPGHQFPSHLMALTLEIPDDCQLDVCVPLSRPAWPTKGSWSGGCLDKCPFCLAHQGQRGPRPPVPAAQ